MNMAYWLIDIIDIYREIVQNVNECEKKLYLWNLQTCQEKNCQMNDCLEKKS